MTKPLGKYILHFKQCILANVNALLLSKVTDSRGQQNNQEKSSFCAYQMLQPIYYSITDVKL